MLSYGSSSIDSRGGDWKRDYIGSVEKQWTVPVVLVMCKLCVNEVNLTLFLPSKQLLLQEKRRELQRNTKLYMPSLQYWLIILA